MDDGEDDNPVRVFVVEDDMRLDAKPPDRGLCVMGQRRHLMKSASSANNRSKPIRWASARCSPNVEVPTGARHQTKATDRAFFMRARLAAKISVIVSSTRVLHSGDSNILSKIANRSASE
jgi:hypothetical protein